MSGAGRSRTPVTRAAHLFKQAFKGLMTRADIDIEGARPRSPCEGSQGAVHPVTLVEMLQETLVDGVGWTTATSFHWVHHDQ
jgi:hypothetical protein